MKILGLIPARGGSKGVPRKNIRLLQGKPLIAHTILAALEAKKNKWIMEVIVSTEDIEIVEVSRIWGAEVVERPVSLAEDKTPMVPVALHVLEVLKNAGRQFDVVLLLQPTCPFRTVVHIHESLELLEKSNADAVIGVLRVYDAHPARMYRIQDGRLSPWDPAFEKWNRQYLPPVYHRNGSIYGIRVEALMQQQTFFPKNSVPYVMQKKESVNIDDEEDFLFAEFLMEKSRETNC